MIPPRRFRRRRSTRSMGQRGVFVGARCAVGSPAVAEFVLAETEMLLGLGPFGLGRFAVLRAGAQCAPPADEGTVVADEFALEDGGVVLGGVDVRVAEEFRRDADWQAAGDRFFCELR
jgi:hypothetical protein